LQAMEQRAALHHRLARQLGQSFDSTREQGPTMLTYPGR
jgi:hypothetical protein